MSGLPDIFLDYQKAWVEDTADTKVLVKSRRIGGSWSEAAHDVLYAAAEDEEGGNVIYIAYNKHISAEFIEDCATFARLYDVAVSDVEEEIFEDEGKDILTYVIRFASGYKIEALSSSPKGFRGKGRNRPRIVIDEAAHIENFDQVLKSAIALKIWGAKIRIISSHNGADNPFNEFVEDVRAGKRPGVIHEYDFERAIRDGLCKRIFAYTGKKWSPEAEKEFVAAIRKEYGDDAEEELDCIPSKGEGAVFTRMMIKNCMDNTIPIIRWEKEDRWEEEPDDIRKEECGIWCRENLDPLLETLDEKRRHWFGEDFARIRNLTVIWPGYEKEDTKIRLPFAVELANIPYKQQIQILFHILDRLPRFAGGAMDARGNGQSVAEYTMQRYGADRIHRIMPTEKFYSENFPVYKSILTGREIEIPEHSDITDDHRAVRKIKGVPRITDDQENKKTGRTKARRHGDSAIAGLMLTYAVNNIDGEHGTVDYESVVKRRIFGEGTY